MFKILKSIFSRQSRGLSYIEIIVTVAIIGIITVVSFTSYTSGTQRKRVEYTAHQIAQDIQRAQALSLTGKKPDAGSSRPCGHGLKFIKGSGANIYVLFREMPDIATGDCSDSGARNKKYDAGEEIENGIVYFQSNIYIKDILYNWVPIGGDGSFEDVFLITPFANPFQSQNVNVSSSMNSGDVIRIVLGNASFEKTISIQNQGVNSLRVTVD